MGIIVFIIVLIVIIIIVQFASKSKKKRKQKVKLQPQPKANNINKIPTKKNSSNKTNKMKYEIDDDFFISNNIIGSCSISSNKKYIIVWNDSSGDTGGYRESGNGKIYIIDDGILIKTINTVQRPNSGKITNNGNFIIEDWLLGDKRAGIVYIYNVKGELLFNQKVEANILNSSISEDGNYTIIQTANNDEGDDGNSIFFINISKKQLLWKIKNQYGWADKYLINPNEKLIYTYQSKDFYRYDFEGNFLDTAKLEKDKEKNGSGYDLIEIAMKKIRKWDSANIPDEEFSSIENLLTRAMQKDISDYTKASAYRKLGELYLGINKKQEALNFFEKAISYNPKIGLKRLITSLKKNDNLETSNTINTSMKSKIKNTKKMEPVIVNFIYDPMQIQRQGIQLLESINILNNTKNIDTLKGRFEFIKKFYDYFIKASFNKRYLTDIQKAIDEYKTMYYDKILKDFELSLIIKPDNQKLNSYYGECLINCFMLYYDEQKKQIQTLKRQNAKERRLEKIIEIAEETLNELNSKINSADVVDKYTNKLVSIKDQVYNERYKN